tara:strand:- start:267 stop:701 length:435 start_codon:yes stop_codon:yes gene_type:complete
MAFDVVKMLADSRRDYDMPSKVSAANFSGGSGAMFPTSKKTFAEDGFQSDFSDFSDVNSSQGKKSLYGDLFADQATKYEDLALIDNADTNIWIAKEKKRQVDEAKEANKPDKGGFGLGSLVKIGVGLGTGNWQLAASGAMDAFS